MTLYDPYKQWVAQADRSALASNLRSRKPGDATQSAIKIWYSHIPRSRDLSRISEIVVIHIIPLALRAMISAGRRIYHYDGGPALQSPMVPCSLRDQV